MTRKHFNAIAALIADHRRVEKNLADMDTIGDEKYHRGAVNALDELAEGLIPVLRSANSRFDADRFLAACKVED